MHDQQNIKKKEIIDFVVIRSRSVPELDWNTLDRIQCLSLIRT